MLDLFFFLLYATCVSARVCMQVKIKIGLTLSYAASEEHNGRRHFIANPTTSGARGLATQTARRRCVRIAGTVINYTQHYIVLTLILRVCLKTIRNVM